MQLIAIYFLFIINESEKFENTCVECCRLNKPQMFRKEEKGNEKQRESESAIQELNKEIKKS